MDKSIRGMRDPGRQTKRFTDTKGETPNVIVSLKALGPEVSQVEFISRGGLVMPAAETRKRSYLMPGVAIICLFAGSVYYLHRTPANSGAVSAKHTASITETPSAITANSATINWTTALPSTSQVEYGTTPAHGFLSAFSDPPVTSHSVTLTGLVPGITYSYAALSVSATGEISTTGNSTFTTSSAPGLPVISRVAADGVSATSATITWNTDQPLTSQVQYGTRTDHGSLSAFKSALSRTHSLILTGLTPGTAYNYAALSANASGKVAKSALFAFTTTQVTGSPGISQATAGRITATSVTIAWTTDQPSASQLEYGTTMAYGSLSAYTPALVTSHLVVATGLTPGTTYNAVALSADAAGHVGRSANLTFTTVAAPPVIRQLAAVRITANSASIIWMTDQPSTSQIQYGTTMNHGSFSAFDPTLVTTHLVALRALTPGSTYEYSAMSTNSSGMQNSSHNLRFGTLRSHLKFQSRSPKSGETGKTAF